jgi:hypothetical protein
MGVHRWDLQNDVSTRENQEDCYTRFKKGHRYKYQAIISPDGLISSLSGPWEGPKTDWAIYLDSGIGDLVKENARNLRGERVFVFGDAGYFME